MGALEQHLHELRQGVGAAHAHARKALGEAEAAQNTNGMIRQQLQRMQQDINNLSDALSSVQSKSSGTPDHIRYIDQIPGRRMPYDFVVTINIGANVSSEQQASNTVTQDGPFVAVARYASFQSAYSFSYTDPVNQNTAAFQGRSFGRFRPPHSAWDLNDGQPGYQPVVGGALPGTGGGIIASPSNHSSFRSMQFDGVVQFLNQGAGYLRQTIPVPSSFYTQQINEPFLLGALDFFERGEVLQWKVTPTHINNPAAGNVTNLLGAFPFIQSQYDVHEGILDPALDGVTTDPVRRLPDGILYIGFHGYRIMQPPGPVSMT